MHLESPKIWNLQSYFFRLNWFYHDKPGINECAVPKKHFQKLEGLHSYGYVAAWPTVNRRFFLRLRWTQQIWVRFFASLLLFTCICNVHIKVNLFDIFWWICLSNNRTSTIPHNDQVDGRQWDLPPSLPYFPSNLPKNFPPLDFCTASPSLRPKSLLQLNTCLRSNR